MRNLKTILPMLAFVLAIGMSFAFVGATEEKEVYDTKFILVEEPNGWATVEGVICEPDNDQCIVRFAEDLSTEYTLYNSKNVNDPAEGNGVVITKTGSAPDPDPEF